MEDNRERLEQMAKESSIRQINKQLLKEERGHKLRMKIASLILIVVVTLILLGQYIF